MVVRVQSQHLAPVGAKQAIITWGIAMSYIDFALLQLRLGLPTQVAHRLGESHSSFGELPMPPIHVYGCHRTSWYLMADNYAIDKESSSLTVERVGDATPLSKVSWRTRLRQGWRQVAPPALC